MVRAITLNNQGSTRYRLLSTVVRDFPPAYFAMVMATGTVSIAGYLLKMDWVTYPLLILNFIAYAIFIGIYALRAVVFRRQVIADLISHQKGPGYFTAVASTCIVGSQCILILDSHGFAGFLWGLAIALWIGLTYTIFTAFTVKETKPGLADGISGAWLLAVVATQGIAVLSALLAAHYPEPYRVQLNFFALSMWLWGGMLYIWMISLIFYRYAFFKFSPTDLSPPYWINMGAMAISCLAGTRLIQNVDSSPFLATMAPFLKGFTVFFWATGTWWIPMLLILGFWRHVYMRQPLRYDPLYWGAVFPLAMYTVCTFGMAHALELEFLYIVPKVFVFVALAAWSATFFGLVYQIVRGLARN